MKPQSVNLWMRLQESSPSEACEAEVGCIRRHIALVIPPDIGSLTLSASYVFEREEDPQLTQPDLWGPAPAWAQEGCSKPYMTHSGMYFCARNYVQCHTSRASNCHASMHMLASRATKKEAPDHDIIEAGICRQSDSLNIGLAVDLVRMCNLG